MSAAWTITTAPPVHAECQVEQAVRVPAVNSTAVAAISSSAVRRGRPPVRASVSFEARQSVGLSRSRG